MYKYVVVVSDEGLGGVLPFGKAAQKSGYVPILLTGIVPDSRLEAWKGTFAATHVLDNPYSVTTLVEQAQKTTDGHLLIALFSCYDGLVVPAAQAAAKLGLPHPSIAGLKRSRNKYLARLTTREHGLPTPRFVLVTSESDCASAAKEIGFPAIIKPLNGMASHLVRRTNSLSELRSAYRALFSRVRKGFSGNYANLSGSPSGDPAGEYDYDPLSMFLLEEFLDGSEYSAEVIVRDGRVERVALFHKFIVDQNGFLEKGFANPPLNLNPAREKAIWNHIEDCLMALGIDQAAAHVEIIDTSSGPLLVEVNAGRAGGQILVHAVRKAKGIDLIAEILTLQSGLPRPQTLEPTIEGRVITLTVFPSTSGRLEKLEGLDKVGELPGVIDVIPFCQPGSIIDIEDKEFFAVNLFVSGIDDDALSTLYEQACQLVQFTIVPLSNL